MQQQKLEEFLNELTQLLIKYRIGIANEPTLYELEDIDLDRVCTIDQESKLYF